ncbi:MAG: site-specific integrase [Phycisphaerae bacterium]|nr:site-specific integrase [Phycisphaerae bacterium]
MRLFKQHITIKRGDGTKTRKLSRKWYCEATDADGRTKRVPLSVDKATSQFMAGELARKLEQRRRGLMTKADDEMLRPVGEHVREYETHLVAKDVTAEHLRETLRRLQAFLDHAGVIRLTDITATRAERYLATLRELKRGPRTYNLYLSSMRAFVRWCVKTERLPLDPLATLAAADEATDIRRRRRSMTDDEVQRLLYVARLRPLADYGRESVAKDDAERTKRRDTWRKAPLTLDGIDAAAERGRWALRRRPTLIAKLERRGRERALVYTTLVHTGLRRGELAAMTWARLDLDGDAPSVTVEARDAKGRRTESVPLRDDLAAALRAWRTECGNPAATAPVFHVPRALVNVLKRDLAAAGIPFVDESGRRLDVHAMRHTTATHLARAGVAPRTAQQFLRHSKLDLTMQTYTDPRLLDLRPALDALPPLDAEQPATNRQRATGTADAVPTGDKSCLVFTGKFTGFADGTERNPSQPDATDGAAINAPDCPIPLKSSGKDANGRNLSQSDGVRKKSGRRDSNPQRLAWKDRPPASTKP